MENYFKQICIKNLTSLRNQETSRIRQSIIRKCVYPFIFSLHKNFLSSILKDLKVIFKMPLYKFIVDKLITIPNLIQMNDVCYIILMSQS